MQLPNGQIQTQIPIIKIQQLLRCNFDIEPTEFNGVKGMAVHFTVVLGEGGAERYSVLFDMDGFERFSDVVAAAGSGLTIARRLQ